MENKGLFAIAAVLFLALGLLTGLTITPSEIVVQNNVTETEVVYVNNTVEVPVIDMTIFNKAFESDIKELELENAGIISFEEEFDEYDLEEFLEDNLPEFDELVWFSEQLDEFDVDVKELGLEDAEDAKVVVTKVFKVKYENDDNDDGIKAYVEVEGIVTYDEDDNEYNCDIEYKLL